MDGPRGDGDDHHLHAPVQVYVREPMWMDPEATAGCRDGPAATARSRNAGKRLIYGGFEMIVEA